MLLILFTLVLILGIAFYQAVQGFYSAIVMAILTIACAVLAFQFYEPLGDAWLYARMPEYADAVGLFSLFFLSLLALRLLFDRFMGGNALTGMWTDRIAGGLVGLVTSLIVVGVMMISVQMLPFGTSILGFVPFNDNLKRDSGLFPYPDEFTVGLVNSLSAGTPGGEGSAPLAEDPAKPYSYIHDDLLLELFCARNTGRDDKGEYLHGSLAVMPNGLSVRGAYAPPEGKNQNPWIDDIPGNPLVPSSEPTKVLVIRIVLTNDSGAKDPDKAYRLPGSQFRLVSKNNKSYYPVGYLTYLSQEEADKQRIKPAFWTVVAPADDKRQALPGKIIVQRTLDPASPITVDWVYRIPAGETPSYMVFRKVAKSPVPEAKPEMPDTKDALGRKYHS